MMIQKRNVTVFIILLVLVVNIVLSSYIEYQKQLEVQRLVEIATTGSSTIDSDTCFRNGAARGSCGAVQNSKYGILLGISTALVGVLYFTLLFLVFLLLLFVQRWHPVVFDKTRNLFRIVLTLLIIGGVYGAAYFIFLQIVVINSICTYCIMIDVLMILIGGLFLALRKTLF